MSIHGICYDNGMSGNCNTDCELFGDGKCECPEDVMLPEFERFMEEWPETLRNEFYTSHFGEVKLWALRYGEKLTDFELFVKVHDY